jgi:succinate dehydrogenase/fumarate reductase-like Fe-S protein
VQQPVQAQQQVQESVQAQVPQLVLEPERVLQRVRELVLQPEQVQELRLVRHLHHQQLQSRFQQQQSRLRQREFLSTLQQLVKALQCQLCL